MDQYKDFAEIYDELIYSDINYEEWSETILNLCSDLSVENKDYLDLACGTGNLTENLGKHFRNIWAVDLSSQMLTEAENKLRAKGLKAKFICQDISSLKLNHKFDLITCCLDSVNYITEDSALEGFFNSVALHLKDDGLFIFDINSFYKLTEILGDNIYTYDDNGVVYIWENSLEDNLVHMNLTFFVKEENLYRRFDEEHIERAYKDKFLSSLIEKSGLKIIKRLNNYESKPVDDACERIVYVVKK